MVGKRATEGVYWWSLACEYTPAARKGGEMDKVSEMILKIALSGTAIAIIAMSVVVDVCGYLKTRRESCQELR